MTRKKKVLDKDAAKKSNARSHASKRNDARSSGIDATKTISEELEDEDECKVVRMDVILAQQQVGEFDYLRLRSLKGLLPLAFFSHEAFKGLRILNLRGCHLKRLPSQISLLTNLRYLDITGMSRIELPFQLSRLNLQRILFSDNLLDILEDFWLPYEPRPSKNYCRDRTCDVIPKLSRLAAKALVETCSLAEIDELREVLPHHLVDYVVPQVCAECGSLGHEIFASRIRKTVVAFQPLPLHYPVCSIACLGLLQDSWALEDALNREKRWLRQQKFGGFEDERPARYQIVH